MHNLIISCVFDFAEEIQNYSIDKKMARVLFQVSMEVVFTIETFISRYVSEIHFGYKNLI
jgi:hypothetical protein